MFLREVRSGVFSPSSFSSSSSSSSGEESRSGRGIREGVTFRLREASLTGKSWRQLRQVPRGVLIILEKKHSQLPKTLLELERLVTQNNVQRLRGFLLLLYHKLRTDQEQKKDFVLLGGLETLVRLIFQQEPHLTRLRSEELENKESSSSSSCSCSPSPSCSCSSSPSQEEVLVTDSLVLLSELLVMVPGASERLASDRQFLSFLFLLMENKHTFTTALSVTEEILNVCEDNYDIGLIRMLLLSSSQSHFISISLPLSLSSPHALAHPLSSSSSLTFTFFSANFHRLVNGFSERRLAYFCRVLALLTFEPESRSITSSSPSSSSPLKTIEVILQQGRSSSSKVLTKNHGTYLFSPISPLPLFQQLSIPSLTFHSLLSPFLSRALCS
jgi:hypothetical protein